MIPIIYKHRESGLIIASLFIRRLAVRLTVLAFTFLAGCVLPVDVVERAKPAAADEDVEEEEDRTWEPKIINASPSQGRVEISVTADSYEFKILNMREPPASDILSTRLLEWRWYFDYTTSAPTRPQEYGNSYTISPSALWAEDCATHFLELIVSDRGFDDRDASPTMQYRVTPPDAKIDNAAWYLVPIEGSCVSGAR